MDNQAEMVSALESIYRSDSGLVSVSCLYQRVGPGLQPTRPTMSLRFQTDEVGPDILELVESLTDDPKQTYTFEPMLYASGT